MVKKKKSACSVGDLGSIPGLGRSSGGGHGKSLQYSCLENPHGQRSLVGYRGCKEPDTTEQLSIHIYTSLVSVFWKSMSQRENAPLRSPFSAAEEDLLSFLLWASIGTFQLSALLDSGHWTPHHSVSELWIWWFKGQGIFPELSTTLEAHSSTNSPSLTDPLQL